MKNAMYYAFNDIKSNVVFFRSDGSKCKNAIYSTTETGSGEVIFFEILGQSGLNGIPYFKINGQEKYRRILIQRAFPAVPLSAKATHDISRKDGDDESR